MDVTPGPGPGVHVRFADRTERDIDPEVLLGHTQPSRPTPTK